MSGIQENATPSAAGDANMIVIANSSNNMEQPQTKRQKIEKSSRTKNLKLSITNRNAPPSQEFIKDRDTNHQTLYSPLSSSANSITTPSSSSNDSLTSTSNSSLTSSLSQLLNVRNITNLRADDGDDLCSRVNNSGSSSSGEQSADEVDRMSETCLSSTLANHSIRTIDASTSSSSSVPLESQFQQHLDRRAVSSNTTVGEGLTNEMRDFEESLIRQCLCGVSERALQKPFQSHYSEDSKGAKRVANLCEWPPNKLMQFLSNLQLLFDIYLKQNSKGFICARIMDVCDALIRNDHNLIDEIIALAGYSNAFVKFLAGRVLASFLVIAKQEINDDWLKKLVDYLFNFEHLNYAAVQKIHFSLGIIKRIVEWKDVDIHPLEDEIESKEAHGNAGVSTAITAAHVSAPSSESPLQTHAYLHFPAQQPTLETNYFAIHLGGDHNEHAEDINNIGLESGILNARKENQRHQQYSNNCDANGMPNVGLNQTPEGHFSNANYILNYSNTSGSQGCHIVTLTDSESFDTTHLKCIAIKILENKWPALVKNMSALIAKHLDIENAEDCVLNFIQLWEDIISVKANLSIVETMPFYAQLHKFELLLNQDISCSISKQMLSLFNEALCYGSTLALQDMLPDETCLLAHQIVRHVKDFRILECLPRRQPENTISMIGFKRKPIIYSEIGTLQCSAEQELPTTTTNFAIEMDRTILQKIVLLVLKSIAVTVKEIRSDSSDSSIDSSDYDAFQDMVLIERSIRDVLQKLESFVKHTLEFHPESHFSKILIHLFDDQDDYLIEAMVCTLDVTSGISFRNNAFPELVSMLNPVYTFLEFMKMISYSSDLLLDLLVNNETCFLLYLLRFLKYIRMNWSMFVQSCYEFGRSGNTLEETMSVLIRLRLQISRLVSRQLYPYDISPVLRLLESCECLYEGNELS